MLSVEQPTVEALQKALRSALTMLDDLNRGYPVLILLHRTDTAPYFSPIIRSIVSEPTMRKLLLLRVASLLVCASAATHAEGIRMFHTGATLRGLPQVSRIQFLTGAYDSMVMVLSDSPIAKGDLADMPTDEFTIKVECSDHDGGNQVLPGD